MAVKLPISWQPGAGEFTQVVQGEIDDIADLRGAVSIGRFVEVESGPRNDWSELVKALTPRLLRGVCVVAVGAVP